MGRGEGSHENYVVPGAEGVGLSEGDGVLPASGRGEGAPGGVYDHGTQQEDDPGTWEAHALPRELPDGDPVNNLRRAVRRRMRARPADATRVAPHRRSIRVEVGRAQGETGAKAEGSRGVGGLRTSKDVGERVGTRIRLSKGGPC